MYVKTLTASYKDLVEGCRLQINLSGVEQTGQFTRYTVHKQGPVYTLYGSQTWASLHAVLFTTMGQFTRYTVHTNRPVRCTVHKLPVSQNFAI